MGYSQRGPKELDTMEGLTLSCFFFSLPISRSVTLIISAIYLLLYKVTLSWVPKIRRHHWGKRMVCIYIYIFFAYVPCAVQYYIIHSSLYFFSFFFIN